MLYTAIALGVLLLAALVFAGLALASRSKMKKEFDGFEKKINKYQSIIDQANDAMLVIDIVDGRVHQSNPSAAALLGYTQQELEKKSLFDLHPKEDLERSSSVVADVWEKGGLIYKDIPFVKKNGELLPVECSAKVAPFAGRPAIVIYARDIRERLRLENEVIQQSHIIELKNKDITDSITYAKRIQEAILPTESEMKEYFPDHFVLYIPKDIVSGDFYWCTGVTTTPQGESPRKLSVIAAVDCTGHGVPGAFMSIVGYTIMNQTIREPSVNSAGEALDYLSKEVIRTLKQKADEDWSVKDGMDVGLAAVDWTNMELEFAGANNPMYVIRKGELTEIKGNKQPIGAYMMEQKKFDNNRMKLEKGDELYLLTDGYADQFGGDKGKKFRYKQLKELLISLHGMPMQEQQEKLRDAFARWKSDHDQTDDVCIIGFRI
ncbi:MAG: protein serine/threonine phosphatase [Bacteroidetes bacterium]|nr:MAG: protein serine/threonine phosphatase [Bacteroidota bacterium]